MGIGDWGLYKVGRVPNPSVYELTEVSPSESGYEYDLKFVTLNSIQGLTNEEILNQVQNDGLLNVKYYNLEFRPQIMHTLPQVKWARDNSATDVKSLDFNTSTGVGTGTIAVQIPHTVVDGSGNIDSTPQIRYYTYTYTKPSNYTITSTRLNNPTDSSTYNNKVFYGANTTSSGGAIYNSSYPPTTRKPPHRRCL